jgi:hypothetical protein
MSVDLEAMTESVDENKQTEQDGSYFIVKFTDD